MLEPSSTADIPPCRIIVGQRIESEAPRDTGLGLHTRAGCYSMHIAWVSPG